MKLHAGGHHKCTAGQCGSAGHECADDHCSRLSHGQGWPQAAAHHIFQVPCFRVSFSILTQGFNGTLLQLLKLPRDLQVLVLSLIGQVRASGKLSCNERIPSHMSRRYAELRMSLAAGLHLQQLSSLLPLQARLPGRFSDPGINALVT